MQEMPEKAVNPVREPGPPRSLSHSTVTFMEKCPRVTVPRECLIENHFGLKIETVWPNEDLSFPSHLSYYDFGVRANGGFKFTMRMSPSAEVHAEPITHPAPAWVSVVVAAILLIVSLSIYFR